jgi:hypothetical protein
VVQGVPSAKKDFAIFIITMLYQLKLQVEDEVVLETLTWVVQNPDTLFELDPHIFIESIRKDMLSTLAKHHSKTESLQVVHQIFVLSLVKRLSAPVSEDLF